MPMISIRHRTSYRFRENVSLSQHRLMLVGIVDGVLRWENAAATPDRPVEVTVRLGHISRLFKKGCRLRLQIASSNFPRFDRNPQSVVPSTLAKASDFVIAEQQVFSGAGFPSRLTLPVVTVSYPCARSLSDLRKVNKSAFDTL